MEEEKEDKLDFEIRPAIYSKSAVLWFSFLMTPVYGGVLLMMSLKTIDKRKEAATAFISSLLMTLTQLGEHAPTDQAADVVAVFEAALDPPR